MMRNVTALRQAAATAAFVTTATAAAWYEAKAGQ